MKWLSKVFVLVLFVLCSSPGFSQIAVADGMVHTLITGSVIEDVVYYMQSMAQLVNNVQNTWNQIQHMVRAEQRALNNLKSIADVENFDDFMAWQNRQLYLEREAQARFDNLGVKIGNTTYRRKDIQNIPEAMRTTYGDPFGKDLTEEQRKEMYVTMGLSPGNYNYVKMWSDQEKALAEKLLTKKYILDQENQEAAERYNAMIDEYATSSEDLDTNQILKNIHISTMQQEMVLRDLASQTAEMNEYEMARDSLEKTAPNPPRLSDEWNTSPFGKITKGYGMNH